MIRIFKELYRARRAVAALEFAIVSVPLMMLAFGTVEFGRLLWTMEALQMTATEGARCMGNLASSCASAGAYSSDDTTSYIESVASGWGVTLTDGNLTTLTRSSTSTACLGLPKSPSAARFKPRCLDC